MHTAGPLCKFYISGLSKRILHKFMALLGFRVSKVQGSEILGLGRALSSPVMQHTRPCTDTLVVMQEDPREIGGFFYFLDPQRNWENITNCKPQIRVNPSGTDSNCP